jgi:hypothetical protein
MGSFPGDINPTNIKMEYQISDTGNFSLDSLRSSYWNMAASIVAPLGQVNLYYDFSIQAIIFR